MKTTWTYVNAKTNEVTNSEQIACVWNMFGYDVDMYIGSSLIGTMEGRAI